MKRRAIKMFGVLSLALCAALVTLWVRSYWVSDGFVWGHHSNLTLGRVVRGRLGMMTVEGGANGEGFYRVRWNTLVDMERDPIAPGAFGAGSNGREDLPRIHALGFGLQEGKQGYPYREGTSIRFHEKSYWLVVVPFWPVCVMLLWPAYGVVIRRLRRIWAGYPAGCCRRCGYDLRATPERCPECGMATGKKG